MLAYKELDGAVPGSRDLITYDEIADLPEIEVEMWPTEEEQEVFETEGAEAALEPATPAAAPALALEESAAAEAAAATAGASGGGGSAALALEASPEVPSPPSASAIVVIPDGGDYDGADATTAGQLAVVPTVDGMQSAETPPYCLESSTSGSSMAWPAEEAGVLMGGTGSTGPEVQEYLESQEAFSYDDPAAADHHDKYLNTSEEGSSTILIDIGRRRTSSGVLAPTGTEPNENTSENTANTAQEEHGEGSIINGRASDNTGGAAIEQGNRGNGVFLGDGGTNSKGGDTGRGTPVSVEAFEGLVAAEDGAYDPATPFFGLDEVGESPPL